ncbi:MFS transporter [Halorubrum lacusprofundi]|jgi:MFS family permease|uniref:Major facilitator superfamily MFS_1 n=1 Tax=Halorubrum lacusprofundi (strain ATCC 49239 / DSM 5036 / JCM 8891 / ACAM 34) TaxID=416348 RepID=B9LSY7_HALLT|nr:MFS transporter [Halorubrum lacusprofundi]ACM56052.1 major facilitator superfamily MFS_1 [Halorubrum lacusprofundi ATCC 49239]
MTLGRIREYDVLVLTSLIWFLGKFVRYAFPPLFEPLQASYGVSNAAVGAAFSGFMAVYALLQFPSGAIADRVGAVRVIALGAVVAGVGSLALLFDTPFAVLAGAMLVIGAGTGAHKTVAIRLLSRVYPVRTGRALGAHDTVGALGGVAAPAAVTLFVAAPPALAGFLSRLPGADWRGLFVVTGVIALALAGAFALRVPGRLPADADRGPEREGSEPGASDYLALFEDRRLAAFVIVTIAFSFAYNGAVAFLPLYLSQAAGLSTATANLLYSALFAVTFVQLVSGDLSDRFGRFPVMVAALALAAAALVGVVALARGETGAGPIVLGALVVAFGLGSHGFRPVRGVYLIEALPERLAGGGLGVVRTLLMGAGALAPATVGAIADASGFRPAFGLLAGALALAAVAAAGLWATE